MIKLGILGSGIITVCHFFGLDRVENVKIAAIASVDEDSGRAACKKYDANYYGNYHDLLQIEKNLDGIVIALPNHMHFEGCVAAIEAGFKYILCEKPLCTNSEDSKRLVELVEKNKVLFQTGYMKRFNPGFRMIRETLPDIGELEFVTFSIHSSSPEPAETQNAAPKSWHGDARLSGGGFLTHSGSHHLDLLRYCFGDIASVSCKCRYDTADGRDYYLFGLLKMVSGTDIVMKLGRTDVPNLGPDWKVFEGGWNETVEVVGTKGYIKVENPSWQGYDAMKVTKWLKGMPGPVDSYYECNEQWVNEFAAFVESCRTGILNESASSVVDGYRVDYAIEKIRESGNQGGTEVVLNYEY